MTMQRGFEGVVNDRAMKERITLIKRKENIGEKGVRKTGGEKERNVLSTLKTELLLQKIKK